jgi:hypothetical protein
MMHPITDTLLSTIQRLQYTDKAAAEAQLLSFIQQTFPELPAPPLQVELRPSAVSLNSFNGYLTLQNGQRFFFKTHVEPNSILSEYYNSALLETAGYPIIRPVYASTEYGKQFLIYDLIDSPSVFDLARELEVNAAPPSDPRFEALRIAQNREDQALLGRYLATLTPRTAEEAAQSPVHQLLYHRLAGERYKTFYLDGETPRLPLDKTWLVNGRRYTQTLRELVNNAALIHPQRAGYGVIGHGDAHNGNVFVQPDPDSVGGAKLVYFDPAFAGLHDPLLDLTKPLFHNAFATWMYHPVNHPQAETLTVTESDTTITVEFDETPPPIRRMFIESKVTHTLAPLLRELKHRRLLSETWRTTLKTALFCCPLLTMNLMDRGRFPVKTHWLGLSYAVIMGAESTGTSLSLIDSLLGEIGV